MKDTAISEDEVNSLIPFQALTGNDYISSFFRTGFLVSIQQQGVTWELPSCTFQQVQAYICALYGNAKCRSSNELRADVFDKKYTQKNEVIDLSLLPPCESAFMLHCKRANYVAKTWKSDLNLIASAPEIYENEWRVTGGIEWVEQIFPEVVDDILMDDEYEETYDFDSDIESVPETDMI